MRRSRHRQVNDTASGKSALRQGPIVKYHHERYDGHGYPSKIAGEEIPYLVRIVTVIDTFDAMTSNRSYRKALSLDTVKQEIEKCKGTQFDPLIADAFLSIIDSDEVKEIQEKFKYTA